MGKKRNGKVFIRHPLYLFYAVVMVLLLGVPAVMIRLNRTVEVTQTVNVIVGVTTGAVALISLILFAVFFGKITDREEKTAVANAVRSVKTGKRITIVQKRCVLGNFAFLIGVLAIFVSWILFFPSREFFSTWFWVFRVASVLLTAIGAVTSFFTPLKMLTYKDGFYTVNDGERTVTVAPRGLSVEKTVTDKKFADKDVPARDFYYDIYLSVNGETVLLKKADAVTFYKSIIKAIEKADGGRDEK